MGPFLRYTVLRLTLFAAALLVFALLGAGGWLLVLLAAVASLALSVVLLKGPREDLSRLLASRSAPARRPGRTASGAGRDEAAEDAAVEGTGEPPRAPDDLREDPR